MQQKVGRNDPCPCGSGKKYKNCCMSKEKPAGSAARKKLTAKWINAPAGPNLIERAFGEVIAPMGQGFKSLKKVEPPSSPESDDVSEKKKQEENSND